MEGKKELHRPEPWPELDALEDGYESDLKKKWQELRERCTQILRLGVADIVMGRRSAGAKDEPSFTFSAQQRQAILKAMNGFVGEFSSEDPDSPLFRYYGEAYSFGLIQAVHMIGEERPVLDLIKNREIYEELVKNGFDLVKNNATRAIVDRIIPEMEAMAIAGANPLSVAARLQERFGNQNSNWRRLVRTELSIAAETAKLNEWAEWDLEMVEYTPAPDACPICTALRGDYPIAECPVPGRDTHPHCRCSTRPAAAEVGEFPPAESGGLAQRFEVRDIGRDMGAMLEAYHKENTGVFARGFTRVREESAGYFMATDSHGLILISNATSYADFNPAARLKGALAKIRAGQPLSFEEEYSIESLWHEICHNRAKKYVPLPDVSVSDKRVCMEALNQLVARHTYPEFMAQLGGAPGNFERILESGYGYSGWVRNLRSLIFRLGLEEKAILPDLERVLFDLSYDRVKPNLGNLLAKLSGKEKKAVVRALDELRTYDGGVYEEYLKRLFP